MTRGPLAALGITVLLTVLLIAAVYLRALRLFREHSWNYFNANRLTGISKRFRLTRRRPSIDVVYQVSAFGLTGAKLRSVNWGWYHTEPDAIYAVCHNLTDLFECGYYDSALVEGKPEGVASIPVSRKWYRAEFDLSGNFLKAERSKTPPWAGSPIGNEDNLESTTTALSNTATVEKTGSTRSAK